MKLPDISTYYGSESTALQEEIHWILTDKHKHELAFLLPRMERHAIKTVLEYGCGTGISAFGLPTEVEYFGIDKNQWFLDRARLRNKDNPKRKFRCWDARNWENEHSVDLCMAWDFLKHFALEEWDRMVAKVLQYGRWGAFGMQLLHKNLDNGTEYHHTFVTEEHLRAAVDAAGHEVVDLVLLNEGVLEGEGTVKNMLVWTRRKDDVGKEPEADHPVAGEPGGGGP